MTFKIRQRLSSTKLKMLEASKWAAGNSSALMQKIAQTVDISATFLKRSECSHWCCSCFRRLCMPCMTLDGIAATCDGVAAVVSFIPGCTKIFAVTTASSCFCRTLRNKCKEAKGLLGPNLVIAIFLMLDFNDKIL